RARERAASARDGDPRGRDPGAERHSRSLRRPSLTTESMRTNPLTVMSIDADPSKDGQHSGNGNGSQSWLASLKARLRLTGAQTLRAALEEALQADTNSDETFSAEERSMMLRLLRFGGLRVENVMVPRSDIIALDENESLGELLATFEEA